MYYLGRDPWLICRW